MSPRHGGIPDTVIEGKTGFLVNEGDVEGMAEPMTQLAKDPILTDHLGRAVKEHVIAEFSIEKSIGKLWRILEAPIRDH